MQSTYAITEIQDGGKGNRRTIHAEILAQSKWEAEHLFDMHPSRLSPENSGISGAEPLAGLNQAMEAAPSKKDELLQSLYISGDGYGNGTVNFNGREIFSSKVNVEVALFKARLEAAILLMP